MEENSYSKTSIFKEFLQFLWQQKLWWMIPIVLVLFIMGALIIFVGSSPVAPFIYTLF